MMYKYPDTNLLEFHNSTSRFDDYDYVKSVAEEFMDVLKAYNVKGRVNEVRTSPSAILFDVVLAPGASVKTFKSLRLDFEVNMASPIEMVEMGERLCTVKLALKNWTRPTIGLREIMESEEFSESKFELPIAAGMNLMGKPFVFDLAKTPHLLVAGTTGSGKSTFLNALIMSLVFKKTPEQVQFVMIDPKRVELSVYDKIPHMIIPVEYDHKGALMALVDIEDDIARRFELFAKQKVKSIESYNKKVPESERLPHVVIVIDEYMEMIFEAKRRFEDSVAFLARSGRAAGVHLVLATQRPSADVITSNIKVNIPCRASFTVVDWRESKTILNRTGAERLLGNGDMLFSMGEVDVPVHAQASYVSYDEVDRVVAWLTKNNNEQIYEVKRDGR